VEARFVEVTVTDTDEFGFDAALTGDAALNKAQGRDGTTKGPGFKFSAVGDQLKRGTKIDFDLTKFSGVAAGSALDLTFQGILTGTQYQAILHAFAQNTKTKTLSAPQVTTLNNQTAAIKVVTEFVYATQYDASVKREDLNGDGDFADLVNGVRETRFVNVPQDFQTRDIGLLLNVTPSVGKNLKSITLVLLPEVSQFSQFRDLGGGVTVPEFTSSQLTTSVVIEDGQTVVLGGLMKDTASNQNTKVPILGDIPLVGALFRQTDESQTRKNLLIFVTARILAPRGPTT
jgi:type II secretory pathway component GspD/PulD (secretin)